MKTTLSLSLENSNLKNLTFEECLNLYGGVGGYTIDYPDGRSIYYGDGFSSIHYPDGTNDIITYGVSVVRGIPDKPTSQPLGSLQ